MTSVREVVTYDGLPASAGGAHALRVKNPRTAYASVQAFAAAAVLPIGDPKLTFRLSAGGPPEISERLEAFAAAQLGGPKRRQRTHTDWRVGVDDVEATLAVVADAGSRAVTAYGHPLASLAWTAEVALVDPATGTPYRGINADSFGRYPVDGYGRILGTSGIRATFGTTASTLSLWLAFPADDRLHDAAAHVQQQLPFRLSAKHWRRWRAQNDGSSYRATKIASPVAK